MGDDFQQHLGANFNSSQRSSANFSSEILFTEFYKSITRQFISLLQDGLNQNTSTTTTTNIKYDVLWGLIIQAWNAIRVNERLSDNTGDNNIDDEFDKPITNIQEAKDRIRLLMEKASEAGIFVKFDLEVGDYDRDVMKKTSFIMNE